MIKKYIYMESTEEMRIIDGATERENRELAREKKSFVRRGQS